MEHESKKNLGFVVVGLAAAIAVVSYMATRPEPERNVEQLVQKAPDPPPAKEEPPPPPSDDALKSSLLGLNQPAPKDSLFNKKRRVVHRVRRRHATEEQVQPQETEESDSMAQPSGPLSDADFHATMEKWRGVKGCLGTHKSRVEDSNGALRIAMKITGAGEVVECHVFDESNDVARQIAPCVEKQAKLLRFPSFVGDEAVVKEAKFVF
jgi:hypothetical protein